jgi:hypothetical protein
MLSLKHRFAKQCYSVNKLLDNTDKLSTFMRKLEAQATEEPDRWDRDTYVGDGFECLVEALIKLSPMDKRINIMNYQPQTGPDYGIDGIGYGHDGQAHTVQMKYRSNTISVLTANKDHISNFVSQSAMKYNISKDYGHMTIFTTAKDLHEEINREMYNDKVRTIGYDDIRKLIDGNAAFWSQFRDAMMTSRI